MTFQQKAAAFGRATQARFLMDATLRGFTVALPFDSVPGYDAVVDTGFRTFLVQVKGVHKTTIRDARRPGLSRGVYRVHLCRDKKTHPRCEVLAVWLAEDGYWVFLPPPRKQNIDIAVGGINARVGWEIFDAPIDTISGQTAPAVPASFEPLST